MCCDIATADTGPKTAFDSGTRGGAESQGSDRRDPYHRRRRKLGAGDLSGLVHLLGDALGVRAFGAEEEGAAAESAPGLCGSAGGVEKGGLSAKLTEVGCSDVAGLYWGDEMRLGLIGRVRRVWAPRDVKVQQAVEYKREWAYPCQPK